MGCVSCCALCSGAVQCHPAVSEAAQHRAEPSHLGGSDLPACIQKCAQRLKGSKMEQYATWADVGSLELRAQVISAGVVPRFVQLVP